MEYNWGLFLHDRISQLLTCRAPQGKSDLLSPNQFLEYAWVVMFLSKTVDTMDKQKLTFVVCVNTTT